MSVIHIHRHHHLGLEEARKVAFLWAEQAEEQFDMECAYEEGDTLDTVYFSRAGVKGTLQVQRDQFELRAELGFLVGAFKSRIEQEIAEQARHPAAPRRAGQEAQARREKEKGLTRQRQSPPKRALQGAQAARRAGVASAADLLVALATFFLLRVCEPRPGSRAGHGQGWAAQRHWASWVGGELAVSFGNDFVAHGEVSVGQVENPILGHRRPAGTAGVVGRRLQLRDSIRSMYCCLASSCAVPLRLFQASHLARPTMSEKPGFFSALSPAVPCLYSA
jgi:putative polyhydroxyalkanoate system protein